MTRCPAKVRALRGIPRLLYRLETHHPEYLPVSGPCLVVCNRVSWLDPLLLSAVATRPLVFLDNPRAYRPGRASWTPNALPTIPFAPDMDKDAKASARARARDALAAGDALCLFPEGAPTLSGCLDRFDDEVERIVEGLEVPLVPAFIQGMWGSRFAPGDPEGARALTRPPGRRRVTVAFGPPLPPTTKTQPLRQAVLELGADAFTHDTRDVRPLPIKFARVARRRWSAFCMADSTGRSLTYGETLAAALVLADALRDRLEGQTHVATALPASVGAALANLALGFLGKVAVNLNFTASEEHMRSALERCDIRTILTSRAFVERADLPDLPGLLHLDDIRKDLGPADKALGWLKARFWPIEGLLRRSGTSEDDGRHEIDRTAVVVFSSGSTAAPKGVELTHRNVFANAVASRQLFHLRPGDCVCGALPFFHSFGYTTTLWLPLLAGVGVAYHPNPMEGERVGRLVRKHRCTFLIGTPTFLMAYARRAKPEDFASVRIVISGAEKLRARVSDRFSKRFGLTPLEGYGATELAPVVSSNVPDIERGGLRQTMNVPGTVGRPIPGVAVRVVDSEAPDTLVPPGGEGLLLVRGPNVMKGYVDQPDLTAEVVSEGWYRTGDVGKLDEAGFISITGRLSRFSKIGGEMVPHGAVEEALYEGLGVEPSAVAVTSLPDEKKGEQLVVLMAEEAGPSDDAYQVLRESDLPNLWVPPRQNFLRVDEIPLLGSGKLDLKALKPLAEEAIRAREKD